jgi:hypothetical protein
LVRGLGDESEFEAFKSEIAALISEFLGIFLISLGVIPCDILTNDLVSEI